MRNASLIQYLLGTRLALRLMVNSSADPERLAAFLLRCARGSLIVRYTLFFLIPLATAALLVLAGPAWLWLLAPSVLFNLSWRRLLGCRSLSRQGEKRIAEILAAARKDGLLSSTYPIARVNQPHAFGEDLLHLCSLVLVPTSISQMQARLLDGKTKEPSRPSSPARRL